MRPPVKLAALGVLALLLTAATPAWFNKGLYIPTVEDESTFPATSADTKGGIVFGSDAGIPYWSPGDGGAWQTFGTSSTCTGIGPCLLGYGGASTDAGINVGADLTFTNTNASTDPWSNQGNAIQWLPAVGGNHWVMHAINNNTFWIGNNTSQYLTFRLSDGAGVFSIVEAVRVQATSGVRPIPVSLTTCAAGSEGQIETDVLAGAATGKRPKSCLCTSNGSSVYAWQNLATGTVGTSTTCGTE